MEDYNGATLTDQQVKDLRAASIRDNLYLTQRVEEIEHKVKEIHQMLTQFGQIIEMLGSNPMVKSMLPGLGGK